MCRWVSCWRVRPTGGPLDQENPVSAQETQLKSADGLTLVSRPLICFELLYPGNSGKRASNRPKDGNPRRGPGITAGVGVKCYLWILRRPFAYSDAPCTTKRSSSEAGTAIRSPGIPGSNPKHFFLLPLGIR